MTIALWCLLVAALIPILTVGIAKGTGGGYDNNDPRGRAANYEGMAKRAHAAHLNSFEAFPFFAVAVLVAELKGAPRGLVDGAALVFIAARLGYTACYITDRASLRSLAWMVGFACVILIFISPLWR